MFIKGANGLETRMKVSKTTYLIVNIDQKDTQKLQFDVTHFDRSKA